jgi:hypothetical protein
MYSCTFHLPTIKQRYHWFYNSLSMLENVHIRSLNCTDKHVLVLKLDHDGSVKKPVLWNIINELENWSTLARYFIEEGYLHWRDSWTYRPTLIQQN